MRQGLFGRRCLYFCFEEGSFEASPSVGGRGWVESLLGATGRSRM